MVQTTQSPNMTGENQSADAAPNFDKKTQIASEGVPVMMSGAEMLVQALIDEGVEYIFGYPGGAVLHIYDALFKQDKIEHILVRHEQAAGHMADAYSRVTGKTGVVLATSGPGATNTVTAIATAFMDSIPMVVLSGQVPASLIGDDAFQETDMVGVSRPIVKHSFQVRHASEIPTIIRKAFYIASSGRPGPVVIDIPKDKTAPNEKFEYHFQSRSVCVHINHQSKVMQGKSAKPLNCCYLQNVLSFTLAVVSLPVMPAKSCVSWHTV